jgi:hypothetical protein
MYACRQFPFAVRDILRMSFWHLLAVAGVCHVGVMPPLSFPLQSLRSAPMVARPWPVSPEWMADVKSPVSPERKGVADALGLRHTQQMISG